MTPFSTLSVRRARFLAAAWGLLLLALTSWPSPPEVPVVSAIPNFDKLVHATLYGVEGFLLYFAIGWEPRGEGTPREDPSSFSWRRALVVGGIMAVWGALDEIHQLWIPGRSCELADAVTDAVAGFLGGALASRVSAVRGRET